eukprot:tig00000802_g4293.t1
MERRRRCFFPHCCFLRPMITHVRLGRRLVGTIPSLQPMPPPREALPAPPQRPAAARAEAVEFDADNLARSLRYEAQRGFGNVKGTKRVFAEHARLSLSSLRTKAALLDAKAAGDAMRLAEQFARYGELENGARQAAVEAALQLVESLPRHLKGTPEAVTPAPAAAPAPAEPEARASVKSLRKEMDEAAEAVTALVDEAADAWRARGYLIDLECPSLERLREVALEAERTAQHAPMLVTEGEQRTAEWFTLRAGRLTASSFGSAIGFFDRSRLDLWEQKVGLGAPFESNEAMRWGEAHEAAAAAAYEQITGRPLQKVSFALYRPNDARYSWIGASPDGLVGEEGSVEIKCPFNRGRPEEGKPYPEVPIYYMAQVQGVMEVAQRSWCDVVCWTPRGLALYRVPRDRAYWAACFALLDDFWHGHVIPGKEAYLRGGAQAAAPFRPPIEHALSPFLKEYSKALSRASPPALYEAQLPAE